MVSPLSEAKVMTYLPGYYLSVCLLIRPGDLACSSSAKDGIKRSKKRDVTDKQQTHRVGVNL